MEIIFQRSIYLLFLLLVPFLIGIHLYSIYYVRRRAMRFANFEAIERVTGGEVVPKNYLLLVMRILVVLLFVLTAAGTTLLYTTPSAAYDMVLAFDTSSSMASNDMYPSRLEAAKNTTIELVNSIPRGSKIGVVGFSSSATVVIDLSSDLDAASLAIQSLNVQRFGGTAIGDAIITSTNTLVQSKRQKAIILLTDGQSNTGTPVTNAVEYAKANGVVIFPIGIGENATVLEPPYFVAGVDEDTLKNISTETGGKYYIARNYTALKNALKDIGSESEERIESFDLSPYLMLLAFIFIFLDWSLSSSKYRIIP